MKLATVLHSLGLGLTGSVLDLSKMIVTVEIYIKKETSVAKSRLLANIGPDGVNSHGALAGLVIASPSTQNPDYLYSWTRDTALVFKLLIEDFVSGDDPSLRRHIDEYISVEATIQKIANPSGPAGKSGLGEPKFHINGSAFTASWGRPQRDGPALRASAVVQYAEWLLNNRNSTYVERSLWPFIQLDLDYVATTWREPTFDLFPEVNSKSFFTAAVQHRSLREGSLLASRLRQHAKSREYSTEADGILCFMRSFWDPTGAYMIANTGGGRSGVDSNTVLASIHTFDPTAGCDPVTFQPCSDRALANLKKYVDSFRRVYPPEQGRPYDRSRRNWSISRGCLLWRKRTYRADSDLDSDSIPTTCSRLSAAIRAFADGFLAIVARYIPRGGGLAEQIDKASGIPASAVDLWWSYAAALTAVRARKGDSGGIWGAKGLGVVC